MTRRPWILLVCLGACAGAPAAPEHERELRTASAQGTDAFLRGDLRLAEASFGQALALARACDDAHEVGNAAYNLAAVRLEARPDGAREAAALLAEAAAAFERSAEPAGRAQTRLLAVRALVRQGSVEEAHEALSALRDAEGIAPSLRAHVQLTEVELGLTTGDATRARGALAQACAALGEPVEAPTSPDVVTALGRLQLLDGEAGTAARTLDSAAARYRDLRLHRAMAHALLHAGEAFSAAGRDDLAADRWLRAAAAFHALGDDRRSSMAAERASRAATSSGDPALQARARTLPRTRS